MSFSPPDSCTTMPLVSAHIAHFICLTEACLFLFLCHSLSLPLDAVQKSWAVALQSLLSFRRWDFGCSWQQGLAQEANLADKGRGEPQWAQEAALQSDKWKTAAVCHIQSAFGDSSDTTVTCQSWVYLCQGMQTMVGSSVCVCLFPRVYNAVVPVSVHRAPSAPTGFHHPIHYLHHY